MKERRQNCRFDSVVYSKAEILTEKAFISGVCTNTPTTFTPIIRRPKGRLKKKRD